MISRRTFLIGAAGTAALAACSPTPSAPTRGGHLKVAFQTAGAKETLDPHLVEIFVDGARSKALYDKLADLDGKMSVVPRLATAFDPNADASVWRITLREAQFHDGRPVTAEDVLWSLARIVEPNTSRRARTVLKPLDLRRSRVVDARTVELALDRPSSEFPSALAGFGTWIMPKDTRDFSAPIGSGPFKFRSFTPGQPLIVDRFDGYWDGAPLVDSVEFVPVNDETARINALVGGQVHYAHDLSATSARTYAGDGRVQILSAPGSLMHSFAMKVDRPPFNDPRVREAFTLIADRRELVEVALAGRGTVGNDLFGKGFRYYAADLPQRERNLDQARKLLAEAGQPNLKVTLHTAEMGAGIVDAATLFAEHAKAAGVTVEVAIGNKDTFWADTLKNGEFSSYRSGAMPIETHMANRMLTNSAQNVTKWTSPEFDKQFATLQATVDEGQRSRLYRDMQTTLHKDSGLLVWGFADWIVATAKSVQGVAAAPPNTFEWARFDRVSLR